MNKKMWFYIGCLFGPTLTAWLALAYYGIPIIVLLAAVCGALVVALHR